VQYGDDENASIVTGVNVNGTDFARPAEGTTLTWNLGPHTVLGQRGSCTGQGSAFDVCWNFQVYLEGFAEGLFPQMFAEVAAAQAAAAEAQQ
ncbi:MAG: hypothetical protein NUV98_00280, partial [Candidatus Roizmanbacteria bacterium]|nr:hypothetical protein [Candidatus Roizmanbacteria bacterium]